MHAITKKKIIYLQEVGTVSILLSNNQLIKLFNTAFVLECESNLISLSQPRDISFIYYKEFIKMTLMRRTKIVAHAIHHQNLFLPDFIKPEKAIIMDRKRPTHIVSKNI